MTYDNLKIKFKEELFPLNPILKNGSNYYTPISKLHDVLKKENISFDDIVIKYKKYVNHIEAINSTREMKYHTKIITIEEWLDSMKYNEEIKIGKRPIDKYLYGDK